MNDFHGIIPGVTVTLMTPSPTSIIKSPWMSIFSGPVTLNTPDLPRDAGARLRALADAVDAAWAELDRRAVAAQLDAATNSPAEDAAMDSLEARTPVCPLTAALDMVRPPAED